MRSEASQARGDQVRVALLGRFRVETGSGEVEPTAWPGRRPAELVQLLALAEDHRLPRDRVIDALWPRLDAEAGAANLRKAAHHARQAIGDPEAVVLRGGVAALFPGREVATDAGAFEAAAVAALAADDERACEAAARGYAGDLLLDARYEDWTEPPRERLRSLYLDLLRRSEDWERIVEVDPTDEPAYRELMRGELAAGRRAAAIRWYGRLRTALRRDLGLLPSAETEVLYDECVARLGSEETVFVGRQLELAEVTALLRAEGRAAPSMLVVRGPAGIGKSAFCRQVEGLAEAEGYTSVSVVATETAGPYAPIAAATEQLVAGDPGPLDAAGERARSVFAELTPIAAAPGAIGRPLTRHEVIGAFRRLLETAGDGAPVAMIVDDADLADEATIDLLLHLGATGPVRILVVLAYRPERVPAALGDGVARLVRGGAASEIDLGPLDRDDGAALVAAAATAPRSTDVVARILDLAEGNPFLTLELARSPVAGVPSLTGTAGDAIVSRLVDLERREIGMLERLALASDALDPATVVALIGSSDTEAFALLDRALCAGVLVVSGARYRFRHELVRQALVAQVSPHQRAATHREIAARLATADAPAGAIAHQWLEGGRPEEAQEWLLAAAEKATALGAYGDALAYLGPVLEHEPDHLDALRMRAESLDALGDLGAPAAYATAAEVAGGQEAHELRARQALAQVKLGDPPGGLAVLEGVRPRTVEGRLAEALAHCGAAALGFAEPSVGAKKAAEARRLAMRSGDSDSLVIASWAHAAAAHARGDLRSSVRAALDETHALPKLATSVFDGQLCITQRLLYGARPYPDVIDFATSLAAEADRLGAARGRAFAVTIRGEAKLLAGRLDEADEDLARGVELHRDLAAAAGEAFALQRRAEVALRRGDRAEAIALLDQALAVARESDVGFHLLDRIYGTRIEAAPDHAAALAAVEEAEAAVRGPIETCPGCRITLAVPAAIATARGGDVERANRWEKDSEYLANVVMRLPAWYAALHEIKGHRAEAAGDRAGARDHFRAAATGFGGSGQKLDETRCAALAAAVDL